MDICEENMIFDRSKIKLIPKFIAIIHVKNHFIVLYIVTPCFTLYFCHFSLGV